MLKPEGKNPRLLILHHPYSFQMNAYLRREVNVSDRSLWQDQHQWVLEYLEKFDKFFRPKIKEIK